MSTENKKENTIQPEIESVEKKNNRLMKKTKKELIDIIFRKDDVEAKLRKEKADIELDFNKAKSTCQRQETIINNFKKEKEANINTIAVYKQEVDNLLEEKDILSKNLHTSKTLNYVLTGICIIVVILGIII